jgi:hypothetical protein
MNRFPQVKEILDEPVGGSTITALRNEAGTAGSDPCRCMIFVGAAVVEQQA